jgi:hypothetical protein
MDKDRGFITTTYVSKDYQSSCHNTAKHGWDNKILLYRKTCTYKKGGGIILITFYLCGTKKGIVLITLCEKKERGREALIFLFIWKKKGEGN